MKHKTLDLFEITKGMYTAKSTDQKNEPWGSTTFRDGGDEKEQVRETEKEAPQRQESVVSWKLSEDKASGKKE